MLKKINHEKGWDREGWQIKKSEEVAKQKAKESISEAARIDAEDLVYHKDQRSNESSTKFT